MPYFERMLVNQFFPPSIIPTEVGAPLQFMEKKKKIQSHLNDNNILSQYC